MMKVMALVLGVLFLAGCATNTSIDQSSLIQQAYMISPTDKEVYYSHIPSHGAIGDAIAISSNGGANSILLQEKLERINGVRPHYLIGHAK